MKIKIIAVCFGLLFLLIKGYSQHIFEFKNRITGKQWDINNDEKIKVLTKDSLIIIGKIYDIDSSKIKNCELILKSITNKYYCYYNIKINEIEKIETIDENLKKFFIGYDLLKGAIDEHSLTIGYYAFKKQFITLSIGYTYPQSSENSLSPDQSEYPIFMYKGPVFRMGYEFHPITKSFSYFGIDIYYKHLYFNNITLHNDNDERVNDFTQSELANVYGWHLNGGFVHNYRHFFINFLIGAGMTFKFRNYSIYNSNIEQYGEYDGPLVNNGTFKETQHYLSVILGLNIGVRL